MKRELIRKMMILKMGYFDQIMQDTGSPLTK